MGASKKGFQDQREKQRQLETKGKITAYERERFREYGK